MNESTNHFDEMTCLMYLEGQLDRSRALELSAHADSCMECRTLLRLLERESKFLTQVLLEENESVPARLLSPPEREKTSWGWIVTFGLAAAGAYTVWTGIEQLQQQLGQAGFGEGNLLTMLFFGGVFWKGWGTMTNFIEILAISTLGMVAFGLLRRSWRRWTTLALVMSALLLALGIPQPAAAAEVKKVQSYVLPKGETIKNDLMVFGNSARIEGTVDGDLITFGHTLTVNGHVTGDVISFAQYLNINGQVDGNIRGFANTANLKGTVAKNVTIFVQNLDVDSAVKVGGGLTAFTGDGAIDGHVGRDLMVFGGRIALNGSVGGNATLHCDRLNISSSAEIIGKASYKGSRQPEVDPAAKLASPLAIEILKHTPDYAKPRYWLHQALHWGAAFLFGLLLILLMPRFFGHVVATSREYLFAPLLGFATLVGVPILAIIACITVVGLGVGIASVLLWLVALYASQTFVSVWVGEMLMKPEGGSPSTAGGMIGRLAIGLVILRIAFIVPYVGFWIKCVVILWGLGALALALFRKNQTEPLAAA
jgi:cytoskeletal protein CcmA (bactofilin family)